MTFEVKNVFKEIRPVNGINSSNLNRTNQNLAVNNKKDTINVNNTLPKDLQILKEDFEKTKNQQGIIGRTWDGFKNLTGIGDGSDKVDNAIKQVKKGEKTVEEAKKSLEDYKDGQKTCVDVVADLASGIIAIGAFALSVPTGGLGLPAGLALSTAVGAGIKTGIKFSDASLNGREYNADNALYDVVTGGANGLLAPVTNGLGNTLIKTIGAKLGLEIVGEGAKTATTSTLKGIILNQSIDVTGGSLTKRAAALGAGMALDGSLSGGIYGSTAAAMEGKNADEVAQAGAQGFIGGLIMAPVIGGGFRMAGKLGKKVGDSIFSGEETKPASSAKPDRPDKPVRSTEPTKPTEPANPDTEQKSAPKDDKPVGSTEPKKPTEPANPDTEQTSAPKDDKPVRSTEPTKSTEHANPDKAQTNAPKDEKSVTAQETNPAAPSVDIQRVKPESEKPAAPLKDREIPHYTESEKSEILSKIFIDKDIINFSTASDETYFKAKKLTDKGLQYNVYQLTQLDEKQFKIVEQFLEKGYGLDHKSIGELYGIAQFDETTLKKAHQLVDTGIKFNVEKLSKLNDKNFPKVFTILETSKMCNPLNLEQIAKLENEEFERAMELIKMPAFETGSYVAHYSKMDKTHFEHVKKLAESDAFKKLQSINPSRTTDLIKRFSSEEFSEKQLKRLEEIIDTKWYKEEGVEKTNGIQDNIIKVSELNDFEYHRIKKRDIINKYGIVSSLGLAKLDDEVWNALNSISYIDKIGKYAFNSYEGEVLQKITKYALNPEFSLVENLSELSIKSKRQLLDLIDSTNMENLDIELIKEIGGGTIFLPKTEEEVPELLNKLLKSMGINTKPLSEELKAGFYEALSSIERPNSRFRNFNFKNGSIKLTYPREDFIKDVSNLTINLTRDERNTVCSYFGFEIKDGADSNIMRGYPISVQNREILDQIREPELKEVIKQMEPLVKKFSEENTIIIEGEEELTRDLNKIIKAFPEFITEIGKTQHLTHHYTLDIHSLKVLQGVINNPKFAKLPDEDKAKLKIAALFHDITKEEASKDKPHPLDSAIDMSCILGKLKISTQDILEISDIIKHHNWLELYNKRYANAKEIADNLNWNNAFEMECILTEADLKAVQENNAFFENFKEPFEKGKKEIGEILTNYL